MRHKFFDPARYLLLISAVCLLTAGIIGLSIPSLDGVEKGVVIKEKIGGGKAKAIYISPKSEDFIFSDHLPKHVVGAIITSEDEDFYTHHGVSMDETIEAAKFDISHFTLKHGGSTITQQLVKNVYFSSKRTFSRKIAEAITAVKLEKKLSKKQILDYYINIVEFGSGIYGIKEASYCYFKKNPEELTPKEAAALAVLMPRPKYRGRMLMEKGEDNFQKKRIADLLWKMKENGYLSSSGA